MHAVLTEAESLYNREGLCCGGDQVPAEGQCAWELLCL